MRNDSVWDRLDRLASHVLAGEAVFFVGSGFSIDSEGNTARRLTARLVARFESLACVVSSQLGESERTAIELWKALGERFGLSMPKRGRTRKPAIDPLLAHDDVKRLADKYFETNDWMCSAFDSLLQIVLDCDADQRQAMFRRASSLENRLLRFYNPSDRVPLKQIKLKRFGRPLSKRQRGKVLFLETIGFDDPEIMGGQPYANSLQDVQITFTGKLLPRHFVLARFAREGWSPLLLTTNFDLLIEGAYRLCGFNREERPQALKLSGETESEADGRRPRYSTNCFDVVARPQEYLCHGDGHRSAVITKIHGCADVYRSISLAELADYLDDVIFTYRDIQNWRDDSWSRDLLANLVRTRTIVFCGYSGTDPVIHDMFRSVYEEMESIRSQTAEPRGIESQAPSRRVAARNGATAVDHDVPAYFFGIDNQLEFYGLEILRAASRSVGDSAPSLTDHPNLLKFQLANDSDAFPTLDELMLWLYHRTMRLRQKQALQDELRPIVKQMIGRPDRRSESGNLRDRFEELAKAERRGLDVDQGNEARLRRAKLRRVVAWTEQFHLPLQRLFAAIGVWDRDDVYTPAQQFFEQPGYFPCDANPGWTAWAVVLEIALRRMIATRQDRLASWCSHDPRTEAAYAALPSVAFSTMGSLTPVYLEVRLFDYQDHRRRPGNGVYRQCRAWNLSSHSGLWQPADERTPDARRIWHWATAESAALDPKEAEKFLDQARTGP